ncbi:MAG TPA: Hsp70 family protein [Bryobacteraceae bacterium]
MSSSKAPDISIGIDLGTTNCALAFAKGGDEVSPVEQFPIKQWVHANEQRAENLLPSFLYIASPTDFASNPEVPRIVVGALALQRGSEVPGRLVASAKSWLGHSGVDRTAAILPIEALEGIERVSPVDASAKYLEQMRLAWDESHPKTKLANQQVLITVPASFDAVARELTEKAAAKAGFKDVVLIEEPQAAFYAWIERHPDWRDMVGAGDSILVVDIGGGTTDFTLIAARDQGGELALERVAVGDHILLGGDNIDLALARTLEAELAEKKTKVDRLQFQALWQQARIAKENLLSASAKTDKWPITILGKGSSLIGGTIKTQLRRDQVESLLLDGFFPPAAFNDTPQRRRAGLVETGLPYAADAAVTRHLAAFLANAGTKPTHVLFNGGVLQSPMVRQRIIDVLNSWNDQPVRALPGEDLMHAVARGAAYYGMARQGKGVRIRGGVPKTYYIGIESSLPAVPGFKPPVKALAVAPFGMEEGTSVRIENREFALMVGEPAEFRFFSSAIRKKDPAGEMIDDIGRDLVEMSPIEVTLPGAAGETVRVRLEAVVTETGQLQIWCVAADGRRWKLEFNVREKVA